MREEAWPAWWSVVGLGIRGVRVERGSGEDPQQQEEEGRAASAAPSLRFPHPGSIELVHVPLENQLVSGLPTARTTFPRGFPSVLQDKSCWKPPGEAVARLDEPLIIDKLGRPSREEVAALGAL